MPKTAELPGQQALIERAELPEGAVHAPADAAESSYADWAMDAEIYVLRRASESGSFTFFDAVKDAPATVRNPSSPKWPGLLTARLHHEGHIDYARDSHGTERWDTSHRPASGGSGVRVWVGTAAKAVA